MQIIPNPNRAVAKKCPQCGEVSYPSNQFCSRCGHQFRTRFNRNVTQGIYPDGMPHLPPGADPQVYSPLPPNFQGHEPPPQRSWWLEFLFWNVMIIGGCYVLGLILMLFSPK